MWSLVVPRTFAVIWYLANSLLILFLCKEYFFKTEKVRNKKNSDFFAFRVFWVQQDHTCQLKPSHSSQLQHVGIFKMFDVQRLKIKTVIKISVAKCTLCVPIFNKTNQKKNKRYWCLLDSNRSELILCQGQLGGSSWRTGSFWVLRCCVWPQLFARLVIYFVMHGQ